MFKRFYLILLFHLPLWTESDVFEHSLLCGRNIHLPDVGKNSTILLKMTPPPYGGGFCKINITAPTDHYLLVSFNKVDTSHVQTSEASERSCPLSIKDKVNTPVEVDLCKPRVPSYVSKLLKEHLRLWWDHEGQTAIIAVRATVITNGKNCTKDEYHPILKVRKNVIFCVSKELACDGIQHILNRNYINDEDIQFCSQLKSKSTQLETRTIGTTVEVTSKDGNDVATTPKTITIDDFENRSKMKDTNQEEQNERVASTNKYFDLFYLFLRIVGFIILVVCLMIIIWFFFINRREFQERRRPSINSQAPLEQQQQGLLLG